MQDEQKKRAWQFSLRDVLLVTLIVGLAVGWFVDHRRLADELSRQPQRNPWVLLGGANAGQITGHVSLVPLASDTTDTAIPTIAPLQPPEAITDPPPVAPEF